MEGTPKVVDLKGEAFDVATETSPKIMEVIESLRATAAGEKHLAVGFFLVDAQGRHLVNYYVKAGAWLDSIGAVALLKHRILCEHEKRL